MVATKKLRDHVVAKFGVAADASDEAVVKAAREAFCDGKMSVAEYETLQADEDDPKNRLKSLIGDEVKSQMAPVLDAINRLAGGGNISAPSVSVPARFPSDPPAGFDPVKDFTGGDRQEGNVRVKAASESYDGTRRAATWVKENDKHDYAKGMPAFIWEGSENGGVEMGTKRYIDEPSQLDKAKMAAVLKWKCGAALGRQVLNEHEMQLLKECLHKDRWVGAIHKTPHFIGSRMLKDFDVKAVLDDATSGGQEAVPEFFDSEVIRTPLLYGELAPYIQYVPVSRGSSADGFSIGTPTFVSTASGSAITPFTTTSFVSAFDTTFFPASCAFEWGLDFESDAHPNFFAAVMAQIGDEAKRWLDEQIAVGDGTTEPQGIFTASGTAVTATSSHTFSSLVYADVIKLAFGIGKEARENWGGSYTRFVMNDAQYRVLMGIATGVTGDTRPIFGMGWRDYVLGDWPVSVQGNISNGNLGLCNLRGYRMYRRQGIQFLQEEAGRTLRLANSKLLLARMRWGGQLTLPTTYMAEMTT